jgi:hypothetical protein
MMRAFGGPRRGQSDGAAASAVLLNWQVPATHAAAAWQSASVKSAHGGSGEQTGCRLAAAASYAAKLAWLMAEFAQPPPQQPIVPSNTGTQSVSTLQL